MDSMREVSVFMAKVAQECGKNEDCINFMRDVINQGRPLSFNERNLLSTAYKGIVGPLRDSIRLLQDDNHGFDVTQAIIECSEQLSSKCDEVINLIRNTLLPSVTEPEVRVFYIKFTRKKRRRAVLLRDYQYAMYYFVFCSAGRFAYPGAFFLSPAYTN